MRRWRLDRIDRQLERLTTWVPSARDARWHKRVDTLLLRRGRLTR